MTAVTAEETTEPVSDEPTMTAVVQIGNSDDKLTQEEWAKYVAEVDYVLSGLEMHFSGFSVPHARWQNAAWVFELPASLLRINALRTKLSRLALTYRQDSIAFTTGNTEFLKPPVQR